MPLIHVTIVNLRARPHKYRGSPEFRLDTLLLALPDANAGVVYAFVEIRNAKE